MNFRDSDHLIPIFDFDILNMQLNTPLFILALVLFVMFFMNKLLFQPVLKALEERESYLSGLSEGAAGQRAEFQRLTEEYELTHQEVAARVGLNRSTVTNFIRLLDLDDLTRDAVGRGRLGQAHARLLLGVTNLQVRRHLAELAIREDWSVRVLEKRIGTLTTAPTKPVKSAAAPAHRLDIERQLSDHLGTRVRVHPGKKKGTGRLTIEFYTLDQFDGLMERLEFKGSEL